MTLFQRSSTIGLDIGDLSVKIVALAKRGASFALERWIEVALPTGVVQGGEIKDGRALTQTIKAALHSQSLRPSSVVASLPEAKTFTKMIRVDNGNSLESAVKLELPKHIPHKLEEVIVDYALAHKERLNSLVLIGAAPKDLATQYVQVLNALGLLPEALDLEPLALARALIKTGASFDQGALLLDLGGSKSTIMVAAGEVPVLTMDARAAGAALTAQLARELKIEMPAAEEMKSSLGLKGGGSRGYEEVLGRYGKRLSERLKEAIEIAGHLAWNTPAISEVLLSGGGAALPGLAQYLMNTLRLKVRVGNPFVNLANVHNVVRGFSLANAARFATAIGLALYKTADTH